jgi:hypothetical protein
VERRTGLFLLWLAVGGAWACREDPSLPTATSPIPRFALVVRVDGNGTVSSSPPGIIAPSDTIESYDSGTSVVLIAQADTGSRFSGWEVDCSGDSLSCTIRMTTGRRVTAAFGQLFRLAVTIRGEGSVWSNPEGILCGAAGSSRCSARFPGGSYVVLRQLPAPGWRFAGWEGFIFCQAIGCGDSLGLRLSSDTTVVAVFGPLAGALQVVTSSSGQDFDPVGYLVIVDDSTSKRIGVNDSVLFGAVGPGKHTAFLTGLPDNCDVTSPNPLEVSVPAGGRASITFKVSCVVWPGSVSVTTVSIGMDIDPSGYLITLDGARQHAIGPNATVTFDSVRAGIHSVLLAGAPDNCDVTSANPVADTLSPGEHNAVTFKVNCVPWYGSLKVKTVTTGQDFHLIGYSVTVDDTITKSIGVNASVTFIRVAPGEHAVSLAGIPDNCDVTSPDPVKVIVPQGAALTTQFTVSCSVWLGGFMVTTISTGPDIDPNGYYVTLDDTLMRHIGPNASVTFDSVRAGIHSVWLAGNPDNCDVTSANPLIEALSPGQHEAVTFQLTCVPWYGSLKVNTVTTGRNLDPNGYSVAVDDTLMQSIGVNGSVTFTRLSPGEHTASIAGVPYNCSVTSLSPLRVTVPQGGDVSATFDLVCN